MGRVNVDVPVSAEQPAIEPASLRYRAIKPSIRFHPNRRAEPETDWCNEETEADVPQHQDAVQFRPASNR